MLKKTGLTLALFAGALLLSSPVSAQMDQMSMAGAHGQMGHMGFSGGDSHFMMLLKSANLTPQQHAQVQQILMSERTQMRPVYDAVHALHEQIAAKLLNPGAITSADLAPLEQKATRYQQQITRDMIETAIAIRNVLTPEQLGRLAQVHQQLKSLHQQIQSLMGPQGGENMDQPE